MLGRGLGPSFTLRWISALLAWVGLPLLMGWTVWVQINNWSSTSDDSFFTYRTIANWREGNGLVYNAGERLEVFSNPLWLFLLAGIQWLTGGSLVLWSKVIGTLFTFLTFVPLYSICAALAPRIAGAVFGWSVAFLLLLPGLQMYAGLGLETPLLMFLLLSAVALTVRSGLKDEPLLLAAALLFGLAGITRPEGPLYGILWLFFIGRRLSRKSALLRKMAALVLVPTIAYVIFRKIYYGVWLPYTFWVKPPNIFGETLQGIVGANVLALLPVLLLGLAILAVKFFKRRKLAGEDSTSLLYVAAAGPIITGLLFTLYTQADWMLFGRFQLPIMPLMIVCLVVALVRRVERRTPVLLALLAIHAFYTNFAVQNYFGQVPMNASIMQGGTVREVGKWVMENLPRGSLIVGDTTGRLGYYGFHSEVRDFSGLTDRNQLDFLLQTRRAGVKYHQAAAPVASSPLMAKNPTAIQHLGFYKNGQILVPYPEPLTAGYVCVQRVPLGWSSAVHDTAYYFELWVRNDVMRPDWPRCEAVEG